MKKAPNTARLHAPEGDAIRGLSVARANAVVFVDFDETKDAAKKHARRIPRAAVFANALAAVNKREDDASAETVAEISAGDTPRVDANKMATDADTTKDVAPGPRSVFDNVVAGRKRKRKSRRRRKRAVTRGGASQKRCTKDSKYAPRARRARRASACHRGIGIARDGAHRRNRFGENHVRPVVRAGTLRRRPPARRGERARRAAAATSPRFPSRGASPRCSGSRSGTRSGTPSAGTAACVRGARGSPSSPPARCSGVWPLTPSSAACRTSSWTRSTKPNRGCRLSAGLH